MKTLNTTDIRPQLDEFLSQDNTSILCFIEEEFGRIRDSQKNPERADRIYNQMQNMFNFWRTNVGLENVRGPISAMARYLFEGEFDLYKADTSPLTFLEEQGLVRPGQSLVDLGCGNGSIIDRWTEQGNPALGIDISPSFALNNKLIQLGIIDAPFEDLKNMLANSQQVNDINRTGNALGVMGQSGENYRLMKLSENIEKVREKIAMLDGKSDIVLSSLTADRVRDLPQLLKNMMRMLKKNGTFALGTLLPVVPEDDGPEVKNRITYAPKNLRITEGVSSEKDAQLLKQFIEDTFRVQVAVNQVLNQTQSSDGYQIYDNYAMFTTQKR